LIPHTLAEIRVSARHGDEVALSPQRSPLLAPRQSARTSQQKSIANFSFLNFARRNWMTKNNTTTYSTRGHPSRPARAAAPSRRCSLLRPGTWSRSRIRGRGPRAGVRVAHCQGTGLAGE